MAKPKITTSPDGLSSRQSAGPPEASIEERLQKKLDKFLYGGGRPAAQKTRNFLNGTWLGEPLHVVLTDVPIGAWTVAMAFDALDVVFERREFRRACDASIGIGLAAAIATAATGATDWSDV